MAAELISFTFIEISFVIGLILGFITIATGNMALKIIVDVAGLAAVLIGMLIFIPNASTSIAQAGTQIMAITLYLVNVVFPYAIGDAISSVGFTLVTGKRTG